ncbi:hypothetical protein SLE2022_288450 [Rubroshorea leprosula]
MYVPGRRDNWGKRFGFVCMAGVQSKKEIQRWLNDLWIGSYKVWVKVAKDRRQVSRDRMAMRAGKERKPLCRMDKLVQPGQSYAQAVMGICPKFREFPVCERQLCEKEVQFMEKEEVGSCLKDKGGKRVMENITAQPKEEVIDFHQ